MQNINTHWVSFHNQNNHYNMSTFDQDVAYITQEMSDLTDEISNLQDDINEGKIPSALQDQAWRTIKTMWTHVAYLESQLLAMEAKENGTDLNKTTCIKSD